MKLNEIRMIRPIIRLFNMGYRAGDILYPKKSLLFILSMATQDF